MSLSKRASLPRHDTLGVQKASGVDPSIFWAYQPGERVRTVEGFLGTVQSVLDGPVGGAEVYDVVLDGGMGGGEYGESELFRLAPQARTASFQVQAEANRLTISFQASDPWAFFSEHFGTISTESVEQSGDGSWTAVLRWPVGEEWRLHELENAGVLTVHEGDLAMAASHLASEDYPELSDILVERPPLEDAIQVGAALKLPSCPDCGADEWRSLGAAGVMVLCRMCDARWRVETLKHVSDPAFLAHTSAWVVTDDAGAVLRGPYEFAPHAQDAAAPGEHVHQVVDQAQYAGWGTGNDADTAEYPLNMTSMTHREAGVADVLMDLAERVVPEDLRFNPDGNWSYDWCRFRRDERCYYPKVLDHEGTKAEGYAVWVPEDRGRCPRAKWDEQRTCPVGEPGPNSGEPNSLLDATVPYEEGGQRGGVPVRAALEMAAALDMGQPPPADESLLVEAARDSEFRFHFTANWKDVQTKAKRIRSEGGVRIISTTGSYIVAEVKGDSAVYQTTLMRQPGMKAIALWECGCAWSKYSWGRSGRWKRYEGRMCSHALALNYEASAQEWMGGEVFEQANSPEWSKGVKPTLPSRERPSSWLVGPPRRADLQAEAMTVLKANPSIEDIVAWYRANADDAEAKVTWMVQSLSVKNGGYPQGLGFRLKNPDSLARKIRDKGMSKGGDPRRWIKDALRYTIVFHPSIFAAQVQDVVFGLQEAGYKVIEEENSWPRGDFYSGLHYNFATPEGFIWELQFHTEESFQLKDKAMHVLYEEFRQPGTPLKRRQELYDTMTAFWEDVEIPDDVLEYPVEKRYLRPVAISSELRPSLASLLTHAWRGQGVMANVRGRLVQILALLPGGLVRIQGGDIVPASDVTHPKYDPRAGLDFRTASLQATATYWLRGSDHPLTNDELADLTIEHGVFTPEQWQHFRTDKRSWFGHEHAARALLHELWGRGELVIWSPENENPPPWMREQEQRAASHEGPITFDTETLYTLMGELALPPYPDGQGGVLGIGGDVDCAPIAQHIDQRLQQARIAATSADMDGCMIALPVPTSVCEALAVDGGESPSNMHVTVAYLGKSADVDMDRLNYVIAAFAYGAPVLSGRIGGMGTFQNDGGRVRVALMDIPGLDAWRDRLVQYLLDAGLPIENESHGYTPHLTIAYESGEGSPWEQIEAETALVPEAAGGAITFDSFVLACGPTWTTYLMGEGEPGDTIEVAAAKDPRFEGVALKEDDDGWYVSTHRARSDSYPTPEDIPQGKVDFIESTGAAQPEVEAEAILHDEPEPALPEVLGAEGDEADLMVRHAMAHEAAASGQVAPVAQGLEWIMQGTPAQTQANSDIAAAAQEFLATGIRPTAAKVFSPAEQMAIINEGEGVTAANLDSLDIAGTHYEALEAALQDDELSLW